MLPAVSDLFLHLVLTSTTFVSPLFSVNFQVAEDMYFEYLLLAQEGKATVPTRRAPLADLRMSKMV